MSKLWKKIASALTLVAASTTAATGDEAEAFWQETYSARTALYEQHIGDFPDDILKLADLSGVWPGGGLFVLQAEKIEPELYFYTTFGFTNADMPTTIAVAQSNVEHDNQDRATEATARLVQRDPQPKIEGAAGYGYEMAMVAKEYAEWPLWFLQWATYAEILNDVQMLTRVEEYGGMTIQDIQVSPTDFINVLITRAQPPFPAEFDLPNGKMKLLIATVITADEMQWSMDNSRKGLLEALMKTPNRQVSVRGRASVIK